MKYHIIIIAIATMIAGLNASHAQAVQNLPPDVSSVIAQRDAEIRRINRIYVAELERLKVSYTKRGDLKNAVLVVKLVKEMKAELEIVGRWSFDFRGKTRAYTFHENGSMTGTYAVSGSVFKGTWKADGDNVAVINDPGEIIANIDMSTHGGPKMKKARYNELMPGRKTD